MYSSRDAGILPRSGLGKITALFRVTFQYEFRPVLIDLICEDVLLQHQKEYLS